jgi:hypothetical protein
MKQISGEALCELRSQLAATIRALADDAKGPANLPVVVSPELEKARHRDIEETSAKLAQLAALVCRGEGIGISQQVEELLTVLRERLYKRPSDRLFDAFAKASVALDAHIRTAG